ncbi:MAG TPA: molybdopterin cofactor-binding domain-containing protein [Acetobacteraceae bacterium]
MTHIQRRVPAEAPRIIENVSRRAMLRGIVAGGGLVLATSVMPRAAAAKFATGAGAMPNGTVNDPRIFVAIGRDGVVTIVAHRSEMGTGSRTSLPMVIADEMEADWARVRVVQAPGDEPRYGNQDTDGSRSVRHFLDPMRECGAAARAMLEAAAAKRWGVPADSVTAEFHQVVHRPTGRKLGYGELAEAAAAMPVPETALLRLKEPAAFRYIGKGGVSIADLHDITTGAAIYGADVRLPGMKYAVIARPPVVNGTMKAFESAEAMKVPGVEKVLPVKGWTMPAKFNPLGGVAVVARNTGAAIKGRDALQVTWDDGPNASYDSVAYRAALEEAARKPGEVVRNQGDVDAAFASAARTVVGEYYQPHMAHATMEPPCATASVADGKAEIWAPVQSPYGTREDIAKVLGLPASAVTVHVTLLGGGFGRKSKCDFAIEAALLSQELGTPVRVQWTREDDLRHGFYHTVSAERIEAGLDAAGKVIAWRHRSAAPTIMSTYGPDKEHEAPFEQGMGLVDMPFNIANVRCETGAAQAHARIGWFRSVSNIPHAFAVQSFVAELAQATGRDPLDMLLELIGPPRIADMRSGVKDLWNYGDPWETYPIDTARLARVTRLAAEQAGWRRPMERGEGMGIAVHRSFLSYVATTVRVKVDGKGNLSVPQVDTAIDCGFHINPERITAQIEGAAIMGLTLARFSEITFKDGRVQQGNFNDYPVVRIDEAPGQTNVHIVPAGLETPPSGVGEPGLPPFAPALCNAIFAATGKRIRRLPIGDQLST